jgi:hypothetical protein
VVTTGVVTSFTPGNENANRPDNFLVQITDGPCVSVPLFDFVTRGTDCPKKTVFLASLESSQVVVMTGKPKGEHQQTWRPRRGEAARR